MPFAFCLSALAQGTAFTYQGRLNDGANPATGIYDLRFAIYDAPASGNPMGGALTNSPVGVSNGLFTVTLDFGNQFPGADRWLEIGVRTNGGGAFATLAPRQPITATPYAMQAANAGTAATAATANSVAAANITGTLLPAALPSVVLTNNASGANLSGSFAGNGAGVTNVNAATLNGLAAGSFWQVGGNTGLPAGPQYLGTTENRPLVLLAKNQPLLRLEPSDFGSGYFNVLIGSGHVVESNAWSCVIGGGNGNSLVGNGVSGPSMATIAGGVFNLASGQGATIGGGMMNWTYGDDAVIAGGAQNFVGSSSGYAALVGGYKNRVGTNSGWSFLGGGEQNEISSYADHAVLAGGYVNTNRASGGVLAGGSRNAVDGVYGSVLGGFWNRAAGQYASVAGGFFNSATGTYATVPGGQHNMAAGTGSLAAGQNASALHAGTFVWADSSSGGGFDSTTNNQFLIRSSGGVGIGTNAPASALHVAGTVTATAFSGDGALLANINVNQLTNGTLPSTALAGTYDKPLNLTHAGNAFIGDGSGLAGLNAAALASGIMDDARLSTNVALLNTSQTFTAPKFFNGTIGVGLTNPAAQLHVRGDMLVDSANAFSVSALRVALGANATASFDDAVALGRSTASATDAFAAGYNTVASGNFSVALGHSSQALSDGATALGVGTTAGQSYSTAMGFHSTAGGQFSTAIGFGSIASGYAATAIGYTNTAGGFAATALGYQTTASGNSSTAMGFGTTASGHYSTAMGYATAANGYYSTALGYGTVAGGFYSFAGGYSAQALHMGTFVWADSQAGSFVSTGTNQFLVRASGGVGINKTNPATALDVAGTVTANGFAGNGSSLTNLNALQLASGTLADARLSTNVALLNVAQTFATAKAIANTNTLEFGAGVVGKEPNAGKIGYQTWSPDALDIVGAGTTSSSRKVRIYAESGSIFNGPVALSSLQWGVGSQLSTDGNGAIELGPTNSTGLQPMIDFHYGVGTAQDYNVRLMNTADQQLSLYRSGSITPMAAFNAGGLTVNGTFVSASDRNLKENFQPVDAQEVLSKVAALPLSRWNYKEDKTQQHVGPMAQDFHAAFGVGPDDKHITTIDESGVALAAIQGLNQKLETETATLRRENAELKARLEMLEELLQANSHKQP